MKKIALSTLLLVGIGTLAFGQAAPVSITGYNQDCIANGTGTVQSSTTTTLDSIYVFYAVGFNPTFTGDGLPQTSFLAPDNNTFQLGNFSSSNVLLLGDGSTGTLTTTAAHDYSKLVFLVDGFNGNSATAYKVNYANGTTTTGTFVAQDNFSSATNVYDINTRVSRLDGQYDYESGGPKFFDVSVNTTSTSAVTSISFTNNATNNGNALGVWAVSGVQAVPAPAGVLALGISLLGLVAMKRRSA